MKQLKTIGLTKVPMCRACDINNENLYHVIRGCEAFVEKNA